MSKKFCFIAIALFWYFATVWSQNTIHRQADIGGVYGADALKLHCLPTSDGGYVVALTNSSGTTGTFATTPMNPAPTLGINWIVLVKYDINGNMQWQKAFGGDDDTSSNGSNLGDMIMTIDGGWLIAGSSSVIPPAGNKTAPIYGDGDAWVIKLDSTFNIQWQNSYGGSGSEQFYKAHQNSDGTYYFAGVSSSPVSGTKTDSCRGSGDFWLVKTDASGNQLWDKTVGSPNFDDLSGLAVNSIGNISIAGTINTTSAQTFNVGECPMTFGNSDIWAVCLDSLGTILWSKVFGGGGGENCSGIICNDFNYYVFGNSDKQSITPPTNRTATVKSAYDEWIVKLDLNGNKIWDKSYGGDSTSMQSIGSLNNIPNTSQILIFGSSNSNVANDKSESSRGLSDYWILKIDTAGNVLWDKTIGGSGDDMIIEDALYVVDSNTFFVGGTSTSTISGDKTVPIYSTTYGDYWCLEWGPADLGIKQYAVSDFSVYPNPVTDIITIRGEQLAQIQEINIMDLSGKIVYHQTINQLKKDQIQLSIGDLTQGVYMLHLIGNTFSSTSKFIKN